MITDKQLAKWIYHQRQRCDSPRRRAALEAIPGWVWGITNDDAWERGFAQLEKWGMPSVVNLSATTPDGYRLVSWINNQRTRCKDQTKRERLESIPGWTWDAQSAKWEKAFIQFKKHGKIPNKSFVDSDGFALGMWVDNQKGICVDSDRRKRLESIPGWKWYPKNAKVRR